MATTDLKGSGDATTQADGRRLAVAPHSPAQDHPAQLEEVMAPVADLLSERLTLLPPDHTRLPALRQLGTALHEVAGQSPLRSID